MFQCKKEGQRDKTSDVSMYLKERRAEGGIKYPNRVNVSMYLKERRAEG